MAIRKNDYHTSEFYGLSELIGDDLRTIAHLITDGDEKEARSVYKDLTFGRYKAEYVIKLKQAIKSIIREHTRPIRRAIAKSKGIFARDDFNNIEAYSIFTRRYKKADDETKANE